MRITTAVRAGHGPMGVHHGLGWLRCCATCFVGVCARAGAGSGGEGAGPWVSIRKSRPRPRMLILRCERQRASKDG